GDFPALTFAFGPDGNLYVANGCSILRYNGTTGAFIDAFVPACVPEGIEFNSVRFGPDGNLYASAGTYGPAAGSVQRYDGRTGADLGYFVQPGDGGLQWPTDIAFGPDGNLYVLDRFASFSGRSSVTH